MNNVGKYLQQTIPEGKQWAYSLEKYAKKNNIPIMDPVSMNFLNQLILMRTPASILEIGTAIGYSALRMHDVLPNATIVSIEKNEAMFDIAKENVAKYKRLNTIELIHGDALIEIDKLMKANRKFDFIFIDAAKVQYKRFFSAIQPLINEQGVVVCDNVLFRGYVIHENNEITPRLQRIANKLKEFNQWLVNQHAFNTSIIPIGDGISISVKK